MKHKLLVLDVEGTLIPSYDIHNPREDETFPAIIDPSIANSLEALQQLGFIIVLATGTDGEQLDAYKKEFESHNIAQYISAYKPQKHESSDSKHNKLSKYSEQYGIAADDIYFYDDAENNVNDAINNGFTHSTRVTTDNPLHTQLKRFANTLTTQHMHSLYDQYRSNECGGGRFRAKQIFFTLFGKPKSLNAVQNTLEQRAQRHPDGASDRLLKRTR